MIEKIIILVIGLVIGIIVSYFFLQSRARVKLENWKAEFGDKIRKEAEDKIRKEAGDKIRKEALKRSRASLKGKISEQLVPLLPWFKHSPADARFIGTPVDYVVFKGLSKDELDGVTFIEVKTGSSKLTSIEKKLKEAIEAGKVNWETIYIEDL